MDDQNKNLLLATALSFLVIVVWTIWFSPYGPALEPLPADASLSAGADVPAVSVPQQPTIKTTENRETALAHSPRIEISTPSLSGSLSLKGGVVDDLSLVRYGVSVDPGSERVVLLSPLGSPQPYYTLEGWAPSAGMPEGTVPGFDTIWSVESGTTLTDKTPVTLVWDNGAGLIFRRTISVDDKYMFTMKQSVENLTDAPITLQPYGTIARQGRPDVQGIYLLHEGIVRSSDGTIEEIAYKEFPDFDTDPTEGAPVSIIDVGSNGWIGITDKYWMTTLIAESGQGFKSVAKYKADSDTYQTDLRLPALTIAPGTTAATTTLLFAGAKEVYTIKAYQDDLKINQFVDSVDWGWFFFLTKPIFWTLHWLHGITGNMGWSIIGLTLIIKTLLFPLAYKSYVSMSKMKKLQPDMEKIKESAGDDRAKLQQEMMALYRKEKVNPAAGCLPILIQIPIFFSLYKVLFVTIEMRHQPFIGWIHDLSAPDPTSILNLFGLLPWDAPGPGSALAVFSIGVYPVLMGITMFLQQKLNPAPTDKTQAVIFAWMPWIFMFMLGKFAAGLVIYWVANNTITFTQQYLIMRSQGVKPDVFGNIFGAFRRRPSGA
jgi:YidC/Oxa1 family membrane protein insertase